MSTIKLMIPQPIIISGFDMYKENPQALFQPPYRMPDNYYNLKGSFNTYFKSQINGFNYIPKINIVHNLYSGLGPQLYIETSVSKALFGNNYNEWQDEDLNQFVQWLISILKSIGIKVTKDAILNSRVDKFHFSKNIPIDKQTFDLILKLLEEIKYPYLKGKKMKYRGYRYHSHIWAISFYDKLDELSIKKPDLANQLTAKGINCILRIEIQYNDMQKLRKTMREFGIKGDITLKTIFQIKILQSIFDKVLNTLHKKAPSIYNIEEKTNIEIFGSIKTNSRKERTDIFTILKLLKNNEKDILVHKLLSEYNIKGVEKLLEKYNIRLTSNPYLPEIFLNLLSMVEKYKPIQNNEFDEKINAIDALKIKS